MNLLIEMGAFFVPGILILGIYFSGRESKDSKIAKDIYRIIESNYEESFLKNQLHVKLEPHNIKRTEVGIEVYFKLPLAYNENLISDLEEVLDKFNEKYRHVVTLVKDTNVKTINNRYLVVHVVDMDKYNKVMYERR